MLSKKFLTFVSAVLAMGLLVGCNAGGTSQSKQEGSTSTSTSQGGSSGESSQGSSEGSSQGSTGAAVTHIVTFYDGGKVYGDPVTVNDGATVAKPATDPTKEGDEFVDYTFDNWYLSGATEAYDFTTPVTQDLDLYSKYNEVSKEYDLVVYVYGVNGASSPTTYITEAESNLVLAEFKKLDGVSASTKILWHYSAGLTNTKFNKAVNDSKIPVDLVISGNKLDNDDDVIACDTTNGKVKMGAGWFANTSRYVAVTAACNAAHKDLAVKLYNMVKAVGPNYEITLSDASLTLEIGDTKEVTATYYGAAPTWALQNVDPAGCVTLEGSTVTAVAAGTAKLVATDAANHTAECAITVSAAPVVPSHDLVVVFNISNANNSWMTEEDAQTLVNRFTSEGQPGYEKDVQLHIVKGVNIDGVAKAIAAVKTADALGKVDAALCRSAFFENSACPKLLESYTPVGVHASWKYSGGQYGIFDDSFEEHRTLAQAFGTFVSAQNVDYFEFSTTPITVKIDVTHQIETELTGLTYTSSNEEVFTVTAAGLITGIAAGNAKLKVAKNAYYVEIAVTVEPAVVEPVTLHFYICPSATTTSGLVTYMTEDNINLLKTFVEGAVPETTTISWHVVENKTNKQLATYLKDLEENTPDLIIGGSGAFGTGKNEFPTHANLAKFKINDAFTNVKEDSTHEIRYMAGNLDIPANHLSAALQVYNLVKSYQAA